jgi:RNA ligase
MSKYPRTLHLPQSPGGTRDDRRHVSLATFVGRPLVITEKLDGSNVCMQASGCFARSHNQAPQHPSFDAFKAMHARVASCIPDRFQVFGEWVYAKHSILYTRLPSYLHTIGIRDTSDRSWLSWDDVGLWSQSLQVPTVPVLATETFDSEQALAKLIHDLGASSASKVGEEREGFVVRWADSFADAEFEHAIGKWVRKGHVQSEEHWSHQQIVRNLLQG